MPTKKKKKTPKKSKRFEDLLDFTRVPDRSGASTARTSGKKSGLGIREFIWSLLEANERLPKGKRLTNAMIERNVIEEFKDRKELLNSINSRKQTANWWLYRARPGSFPAVK